MQDMMILVRMVREGDNRPVHEIMLGQHKEKEAIRKLEEEEGVTDAD